MNHDLLRTLQSVLGPIGILEDSQDCAPFVEGARYGIGQAQAVLQPRSVEQAIATLAALHQYGASFVLQGANTGLVAGSTPDEGGKQFVLSLNRLKEPVLIDPIERTATVTAGVRLSELNEAAEKHGLFFPIDLGADPSIGGMIATNTGGARLIKYGDVRANLCSVDAWLPIGGAMPLTFGTPLRKNNTGVELKHLLCGTGGALGVVLRATVRLHPLPAQRATALVVPTSAASLMSLLAALERDFPEFTASVEGMSQAAMEAVFRHIPSVRNPFSDGIVPSYVVLVELVSSLSHATLSLTTLLEEWLGEMLENEVIEDAIFGDEEALWRIRHGISDALRHEGKVIAFDVSLPRRYFADFRAWGHAWLAQHYPSVRVCDFGHVADGGLHYNLVAPKTGPGALTAEAIAILRSAILDKVVQEFSGSYSAEHGIGPYNRLFYEKYTPHGVRQITGAIERILMPGIHCGNVHFD
ncbi:FAD-binding oxidoreductase [Glaciimonas sp. PCH181]|uniref:FAD-binding oxidoreductase n=1 Tax=Glaciimonas sp. PCH181 TaxID=2133943 RepID=UPI000D3D6E5D|nr:FAD-binding oxidoreductase [Glaciimonas sp. PCH181]PUA16927.1 FAD-binding oxidoreductase [Glaciimonas sp. PCH181]